MALAVTGETLRILPYRLYRRWRHTLLILESLHRFHLLRVTMRKPMLTASRQPMRNHRHTHFIMRIRVQGHLPHQGRFFHQCLVCRCLRNRQYSTQVLRVSQAHKCPSNSMLLRIDCPLDRRRRTSAHLWLMLPRLPSLRSISNSHTWNGGHRIRLQCSSINPLKLEPTRRLLSLLSHMDLRMGATRNLLCINIKYHNKCHRNDPLAIRSSQLLRLPRLLDLQGLPTLAL